MKNRAKKRWFALIILLLCAVVIGLFYWNGQKKMQSDEGYLVKYSLLFTPRHSQNRHFVALRCFAAHFLRLQDAMLI